MTKANWVCHFSVAYLQIKEVNQRIKKLHLKVLKADADPTKFENRVIPVLPKSCSKCTGAKSRINGAMETKAKTINNY